MTLEDIERMKKVNRVENNIKAWRENNFSGAPMQTKRVTSVMWQDCTNFSNDRVLDMVLGRNYEARLKPEITLVMIGASALPEHFVCRNTASPDHTWSESRRAVSNHARKGDEYYDSTNSEWRSLWIEREV